MGAEAGCANPRGERAGEQEGGEECGGTYGQLCPYLDSKGFALHNLASLPHISIAGACSTATHGSGEKNANLGYNANTGEYVDMFKAGIVDPTKVTRSALQNAASIAGLMLTTEVMITKIDEDDPRNKVSGAIR